MNDQTGPNESLPIDQLRTLFPITDQKVYLFNGNICPAATPVREAMEQFLDRWMDGGDDCWQMGAEALDEGKRYFAELINAPADTIFSIGNTTTGINMAALMIRPQTGQNVVVTDLEHMSDVYPWLAFKAKGVEVRYVPMSNGAVDMAAFKRAVDARTAAVSISHVTMGTGYRFDLNEVCHLAHAQGARVVVDAAQSAGAVPIDVQAADVDFLATPTFKWMFGPLGAGYAYVCPQMIEKCDPPLPGWFGVSNPIANDLHHAQWHTNAHKFERGVPAMIAFVGAAAGLRMLRQVGHKAVFQRIASLAEYLIHGLTDLGVTVHTPSDPDHRAGIIAAKLHGHDKLCTELENAGIHTGNWLGYLRIDTACYNTVDELDQLLKHVGAFVRQANNTSKAN